MYMSYAFLRGFIYLLLLSPDKERHTTNPAVTGAHLFKLQPYQKEVSWLKMMMLTNSEPVITPSVAHTCKPPPEPPPKSQLRSIQESKHATLNAPVINVHNDSKHSNWPTFKTQSHKTPKGEGTKLTKAPQSYRQSRIKTASANMVTITLALSAHIFHREQLSTQRCPTLRSTDKTNSSEPHSKQVAFNSPLFMMVDTKTAHACPYFHNHTQTKTFENQFSTQRGPTSRYGFQIQNWILMCWAIHHPGQSITKETLLLKI
jgi:hypothetical protein